MYQNHDNSKSQPPQPPTPPQDFYDDWQADGYEYDEQNEYQPLAYDDYEPPTFDDFMPSPPAYLDECPSFEFSSSPVSPPTHHHAPPPRPTTTPHQPTPHQPTLNPSPLPSTISEHLDNLFKWPRLDPSVTTVARPPTTSAQLQALRVSVRTIELKEGQYASHVLTFRQIMSVALEGGCGTGKSTLAMGHKHFVIFIAPTTVIVDQLASDDCQVIKAGIEPNFEKYQRFACTYDSLPKLTAAAKEAGLNPYKVPLIADECQHLVSDGFKPKPLDACMLELRKFEDVTMASATIPPYIPYFEHLPKIIIKRASRKVIKWSYVVGSDAAWVEKRLRKGQAVLYHLNDKRKIDVTADYFHGLGFKSEHIDSDNKDEMMLAGLDSKRLPDANLYMCTSVFNDGISVHEHANNYDVIISEQSARHLGPLEKVQLAQRFRDKEPDHVYIMRKSNEFNDNVIFSEDMYKQMYERLVARAERRAGRQTQEYREEIQWMNQASRDFLVNSREVLERLFPTRDDSFVMFNEEAQVFEPNLRAIGEYVYSHLQRVCHSSRYMMQHWLGKHDFEFCEIVEIEQETALENDLLKASKSLSKADREAMREHIANFETYNDVLDASKAKPPITYSQAAELLPFNQFVEERKQDGEKEEDEAKVREEYREALRGKVKEAHLEQKAAQVVREHFSTVYQANAGSKPETVLAIAKNELSSSTLTGKALKHLKYKKQLQSIAKGVRNPQLDKVLESAFITDVLQSVTISQPLIESVIDASFERAFAHSERARERFTIAPKHPKGEKPTDEEVAKAARKQWRLRKEFLNCFFEMKRERKTIDGERANVWIPTKALY